MQITLQKLVFMRLFRSYLQKIILQPDSCKNLLTKAASPLLVFPSLQLSSTNANASRIQIFSSFSHYHYLTSFCCVDISIRTAAVDPKQKKGMEAGASLTSICKNSVVPTVLEKGPQPIHFISFLKMIKVPKNVQLHKPH